MLVLVLVLVPPAGKVADGWRYGLPCVTTPIGAEGMVAPGTELAWGGQPRPPPPPSPEAVSHPYKNTVPWHGVRCLYASRMAQKFGTSFLGKTRIR